MTHAASGRRRRLPRGWLVPLAALVGVLGSAYLGMLSTSIVVDLIAWWPVWVGLVLLGRWARGRRWSRLRVSGLVPLTALVVLGAFLTGHLQGWAVMPSSAPALVGPPADSVEVAALSARPAGDLVVVSDRDDFLYVVTMLRGGGPVGIPSARETVQGGSIAVALQTDGDPGWYRFSGWRLALGAGPRWSLTLTGRVDADLSGIEVDQLQVDGSGRIRLGSPGDGGTVIIAGDFDLVVPAGVPVRVTGPAGVPDDWIQAGEGWRSPVDGRGWVVSVASGASLSIGEG